MDHNRGQVIKLRQTRKEYVGYSVQGSSLQVSSETRCVFDSIAALFL